jgi:hypothetical protein
MKKTILSFILFAVIVFPLFPQHTDFSELKGLYLGQKRPDMMLGLFAPKNFTEEVHGGMVFHRTAMKSIGIL